MNFDTGVERLPDQPARVFKAAKDPQEFFPCDGGFGIKETTECGFVSSDSNNMAFGNNEFNTPTLVEAADTAPFFHNNSKPTVTWEEFRWLLRRFKDPGWLVRKPLDPCIKVGIVWSTGC